MALARGDDPREGGSGQRALWLPTTKPLRKSGPKKMKKTTAGEMATKNVFYGNIQNSLPQKIKRVPAVIKI